MTGLSRLGESGWSRCAWTFSDENGLDYNISVSEAIMVGQGASTRPQPEPATHSHLAPARSNAAYAAWKHEGNLSPTAYVGSFKPNTRAARPP